MNLALNTAPHYPTEAERTADKWVHIVGLLASLAGGTFLVVQGAMGGGLGHTAAMLVYALGLVTMFGCSMAYNMSRSPSRQRKLRRLDHAAIYLLIAASYTPFITQRLQGGWAIGMTVAVWSVALLGIVAKLAFPALPKWLTVLSYLALGWVALVAIVPLMKTVSPPAMLLLGLGGIVYSLGVLIYASARIPFRRAIWHGFVVAAAAMQCAAVIIGVAYAESIR